MTRDLVSCNLCSTCTLQVGIDPVAVIGYAARASTKAYASRGHITNVSDGFAHTDAFIDTGSSGGPVINEAGDIVAVVSHGGGVQQGSRELSKTRLVKFLCGDHGYN